MNQIVSSKELGKYKYNLIIFYSLFTYDQSAMELSDTCTTTNIIFGSDDIDELKIAAKGLDSEKVTLHDGESIEYSIVSLKITNVIEVNENGSGL